jgi:hypothetical protein
MRERFILRAVGSQRYPTDPVTATVRRRPRTCRVWPRHNRITTQRIHASVIQAPDSAELAAAIGIAVATSAEPSQPTFKHGNVIPIYRNIPDYVLS